MSMVERGKFEPIMKLAPGGEAVRFYRFAREASDGMPESEYAFDSNLAHMVATDFGYVGEIEELGRRLRKAERELEAAEAEIVRLKARLREEEI